MAWFPQSGSIEFVKLNLLGLDFYDVGIHSSSEDYLEQRSYNNNYIQTIRQTLQKIVGAVLRNEAYAIYTIPQQTPDLRWIRQA